MGTLAQLFETGEQTSQKGHFRNLVLIARRDGSVSDAEQKLLNRIADRLSLTAEQVQEIMENPESYPAIPPYSKEERYERLVQLLEIALLDGITDNEESLMKNLAVALGLTPEETDQKFDTIHNMLKNGESQEAVLAAVL
jgi:uncharacterized tellurite resistance protein B-like protein